MRLRRGFVLWATALSHLAAWSRGWWINISKANTSKKAEHPCISREMFDSQPRAPQSSPWRLESLAVGKLDFLLTVHSCPLYIHLKITISLCLHQRGKLVGCHPMDPRNITSAESLCWPDPGRWSCAPQAFPKTW